MLTLLLFLGQILYSQAVSSTRTCYFEDVRKKEFMCVNEITTVNITPAEVTFDSKERYMKIVIVAKDFRHQGDSASLQLYRAFYKDKPVTLGIETNLKGQVLTVGILQRDYRFLVFLVNAKDKYL